jgi:hypothetical protein
MMPDELTQERIARNDARFREANERIESVAQSHEVDLPQIPFICECADMNCREILRIPLAEYEDVRGDGRLFINAPSHEKAAQGAVEVVEERSGYIVVRKLGRAAEIAERLDPRKGDAGDDEAEGLEWNTSA